MFVSTWQRHFVEDLEAVKKDLNTVRMEWNNRYYAAVVETYRRYDDLLVPNNDYAADQTGGMMASYLLFESAAESVLATNKLSYLRYDSTTAA